VIEHSFQKDQVVFNVHVVPRASRSEVIGEHNGALRVRIAAPPVDGAANEELIRILARTFKVSEGAIKIMRGHNGRTKRVSITGGEAGIVKTVLAPEL
jgi:uncharacterized protein